MPNNDIIQFDEPGSSADPTRGVVPHDKRLARSIAGALIKYNKFIDNDLVPLRADIIEDTVHIMEKDFHGPALSRRPSYGLVEVLWLWEFIHLVAQSDSLNEDGTLTLPLLIRS